MKTNEELVREGYLVIVKQGNRTSFIPTERYYAMMHPRAIEERIFVQTEQGCHMIDGSNEILMLGNV
jgi:hypothetical protein